MAEPALRLSGPTIQLTVQNALGMQNVCNSVKLHDVSTASRLAANVGTDSLGMQADTVTVKLQPSEEQVRLGASELQEASMPAQPSSSQPPNGHASPSGHSHRRDGDRDEREPSSSGRARDREKDKKDRKHCDKQAKKEAKRAKKARRRAEQSSSASEDEPAEGHPVEEAAGGHAHSHEPPWLAPHIAVKILDKRVKGGRCGPAGSFSQCTGLWHVVGGLGYIRVCRSDGPCMHVHVLRRSLGIDWEQSCGARQLTTSRDATHHRTTCC